MSTNLILTWQQHASCERLIIGPHGSDLLNWAPPTDVEEAGVCRSQLVAALLNRCPAECVLLRWPFSNASVAGWQIIRAERPEARRGRLYRVFSCSLQRSLGTVRQTAFCTLQHLDVPHLRNVWCCHLHTRSTTLKRDHLTASVFCPHAPLTLRQRHKHGRDKNNTICLQ